MTKLAIITEKTVRKVLTRQLAFDAVRDAFESLALGQSRVFDVVIGTGIQDGEIFAVKAGTDAENHMVGFKCGTYWADNSDRGLPAHGSTTLLLDPDTGFPQVLINASYLNGYRTAAADAVAVSVLARPDASVLGVIGAGYQAEHEIRAVAEVRTLSLIKVFTRSDTRARWLADQLTDIDIDVQFTSAEGAVRGSDIVVTATPSKEALVRNDWVGAGMHISAMGADAYGKSELDTAIFQRAKLFADNPQQSVKIGEFQRAFREGLIDSADAVCALGLVTLGRARGRDDDADITVFDSSGIAVQDLAVAGAVFEAAKQRDAIAFIDF